MRKFVTTRGHFIETPQIRGCYSPSLRQWHQGPEGTSCCDKQESSQWSCNQRLYSKYSPFLTFYSFDTGACNVSLRIPGSGAMKGLDGRCLSHLCEQRIEQVEFQHCWFDLQPRVSLETDQKWSWDIHDFNNLSFLYLPVKKPFHEAVGFSLYSALYVTVTFIKLWPLS